MLLFLPTHRCFREPQAGFVQHCRLCAGLSSLFSCWNPMGGDVSASSGSTQGFLFGAVFRTQLHPKQVRVGSSTSKYWEKCSLLGTFPQSQAAKGLQRSREWSSVAQTGAVVRQEYWQVLWNGELCRQKNNFCRFDSKKVRG